jgi:hypothetical protein
MGLSGPEVRGLSMRLRCPRERTVPQRLKPATTVSFTARLKPCPSRIEFSRRLFSPCWGRRQGLKATGTIWTEVARLKSCQPDSHCLKDVSRQSISGFPASRSWQPNVFGPPVPLFPGLSDCATAGLGLACSFTDPVEIDPGSLDAVHPGHHGPKQ